MSDMKPASLPEDQPATGIETLPPELRFLKRLVTVLTATMIAGLLTIILIFVTRFPGAATPGALPALPDHITLPAGASATAVTYGPGWIGVVTDANAFLIFDAATGALRQTVSLTPSIAPEG
ncbi:DUF6476 family protein [Frigidibacter sp. SD6-1]|uniref:DUF6476 family protein n=1 Tax=Frigidibacter sp. SD6-1 TaxID=3032581 RepID=UPI0024DFCF50|nr:DUF6476 family protein [Frigidibacter sp. SD6-1]